jgi:hypothetical protein
VPAFHGPIAVDLDPEAAASRAQARADAVRCTCPTSPFCRGQASADWLACSARCRACRPDAWQPPTSSAAAVDLEETPEGRNDG